MEDELLVDAPEAPVVDLAPGMSDEAVLDAVIAAQPAADAADESDEVDPAAEASDENTEDVPETVPEVPEVPAEAAPAAKDEANAENDAEEEDPYETGISVASLRKRIESSAELKAAIAKDPKLRNQLFHSARRAERANQYDEVFQTPALAKEAANAAQKAYQLTDLYNGNDSDKFLQSLAQEDFARDEEGRIKLDANNQPISTGKFQEHMGHYRSVWYDSVLTEAGKLAQANQTFADGVTGADVIEAVRILQLLTEGKSKLPGPNGEVATPKTPAELPDSIKAQLKELEDIKSRSANDQKKAAETFTARVTEAEKTSLETDVKNLLAKRLPAGAAIGEYLKDKIIADTVASVTEKAAKNAAHQSVRSRAIANAAKDDTGIQNVLKISQSFTKELLARELARILTAAAPSVLSANSELKAKVQKQTNQREAKTSGGVSSPSRPDAMATQKAMEATARKAGKQASDMDILEAVVSSAQR